MTEVIQKYQTVGIPGGFDLAVNRNQANQAAEDFFKNRLANFGTFEDAMSANYEILYHSKLSPYINVGLLEPLELAKRAEKAYRDGEAALNNVEGFIRQVVGWREYMYWQYQRVKLDSTPDQNGNATNPLPGFFWDGNTDMNCLKHVIDRVLNSGYCHHIERLMILTNFCLLAEIAAEEVYEWFSTSFIDAYEWVMSPNVYGMGLYADGGQIATKPYISSANYINKMSDYCKNCSFDKNSRTGSNACPFNFLYWQFLITNEATLKTNHRMARMLYHLKNFSEEDKVEIANSAMGFFNKHL
jgi:deoxyribodipyrimidine photolyase-related protein